MFEVWGHDLLFYYLLENQFETCEVYYLSQRALEVSDWELNKIVRLPVWRHIVTGKSLGSFVQISKGYDSYLGEQGKAKKLANIATKFITANSIDYLHRFGPLNPK